MSLKNMLSRIKARLALLWARFKKLVVAFLIAIGLISVPIVLAGTLDLSWTNAVERIDGTAFDATTEQFGIKIYCNGDTDPTFVSAGASTSLSEIVPPGDYECYATTVDIDGLESFASNTITKTVERALPNPPILTP